VLAKQRLPTLCPEPPRDDAPQYVPLRAPPPAPDPVAILTQQQAPLIDGPCIGPENPPHTPLLDTTRACCRPIRHSQPTLRAPPPAPDPDEIPMQHQAPPIGGISCTAPEKLSHAPLPATTSAHCRPTRHSQSTLLSIPNWAKPAVPPPIPMVGVVYAGKPDWPPPRPPKSVPFKKKPQLKPALVIRRQEKDSLRPP